MSQTTNWLGDQIVDHIPALRRYARVLVHTTDRADDLVQDCVERALSRASLYQPDTNLRAWLFTIMRNIAITQTRKEKLRRSYASERMAMDRRAEAPSQTDVVVLKDSLRIIFPMKSYADMAAPSPSLYEVLAKALGQEDAGATMKSFGTSLEFADHTIAIVRPDLSTQK